MEPATPTQSMVIQTSIALPQLRTRWAIWTLALIAPVTAEVLSGSTPILLCLNPLSILSEVCLYGAGALLIREVVRRRGMGWRAIWTLGLAYGILEEGLTITSWFNPYWPDVCHVTAHGPQGICDYSRIAQINTLWALQLTLFHATFSITIPIILAERLWPRSAALPWLGQRGLRTWSILLTGILLLSLLVDGFLLFRERGYAHPPLLPYLVTLALAVVLVGSGLRQRAMPTPRVIDRALPRLWLLRSGAFMVIFLMFLIPSISQSTHIPAVIPFILMAGMAGWAFWRIGRWARHPDWGDRQILALAFGALGFFIFLFAPLLEVLGQVNSKPTHGTILVALVYVLLLAVLSQRARPRASAGHGPLAVTGT